MEPPPQTSRLSSARPPSHKPPPGSTSALKTPVDRPTFTFIDHDDDLTSKRIRDANARKAIRSHVMRDVRRRERLAGLKRVSKRDGRRAQGEPEPESRKQQSTSMSTRHRNLPLRTTSTSSNSSQESTSSIQLTTRNPIESMQTYSSPNLAYYSFPSSWASDPFCTLPGTNEVPSMVSYLIFYCRSVFIPLTFPKEHKITQNAEMDLMVNTSLSDPGSFFGLMTMCAAHRAILAGRHSDLMNSSEEGYRVLHDQDYYIMKVKCIREMNAKVQNPDQALSNEAFGTIINLLTSALIVGLFDEARIHLMGLKRMVELRGGIDNERNLSMIHSILATDIKAATGLMTKPIFPSTLAPQPISSDIKERIKPPVSSILNMIGSGFFSNPLLSSSLVKILHWVRDLIYYSQAYRDRPSTLYSSDHDVLRVLNYETEHQLLSYPYLGSKKTSTLISCRELGLHPVEAVARIASIAFLNQFLIVSPPSSGLGRAITKHLKQAISGCPLSILLGLSVENYDLMAWALFVASQGSAGQPERSLFVERLASIAKVRGWQSWEQVSEVLTRYFYVSNADEVIWKPIWSEAKAGVIISTIFEV